MIDRSHLEAVSHTLGLISADKLENALAILRDAKTRQSSVFIIGNGGSAATASHFANDLIKMAGMRAFAIADMTPTMMAYGNDDGWVNMFRRPINALSTPGDVIVAISCSGESENVVTVVRDRPPYIKILALTGKDGNTLSRFADVTIHALHRDITVQEDVHLVVCHAITNALVDKEIEKF